jgi:cell division protein FtsB
LSHEKLLAIEVDATAHTGYWADTVIELVQEIRRLQKECALHDSYVVELRQLKEENRKLRKEIDRLKENQADKTVSWWRQHANNIYLESQQREQKLIEVLRWYGDEKNYRREYYSRHGTLVEPAEAIYYDSGQRARDILKEIGVTVR